MTLGAARRRPQSPRKGALAYTAELAGRQLRERPDERPLTCSVLATWRDDHCWAAQVVSAWLP
eukprot:10594958-Alexandrium_andersonii.AAC.1